MKMIPLKGPLIRGTELTNVKDFKNKVTSYLKEEEPILVVRHGKAAGLLVPLQDTANIPLELWQEITVKLADYSGKANKSKNIPENEII